MRPRDAIIKQNLEFIYKRNNEETKLQDPDKVSYIRSEPQSKGYAKDEAIVGFLGEWEPLQPAFSCSVYMKGDNLPYPSFEHALHASKFVSVADRDTIRVTADIVEVKRIVNKHKNDFSKMKETWAEQGLKIAKTLLRDKFMRSRPLKLALMKTGHKKLIHQNEFNDQYWGVNKDNKGQNHLGILLQQIRQEIDYGEDIDHWIQDYFVLLHKEDVRVLLNIEDPVNDTVRRRIAETKAKQKAAAAAAKNNSNSSSSNKSGGDIKVKQEEVVDIGDPNHFQFEKRNIIYFGSADFNHAVIIDSTASRIHAALIVGSDRTAYVVDLGSSNGTFVMELHSEEKSRVSPFTFHPIAPAATLTITDSGDVQPSVINGVLQFGLSDGKYRLAIHTNATDLRQAELSAKEAQSSAENIKNGVSSSSSENTIFIRNLEASTTDEELREFLSTCGEIASLNIPRDRNTQQATRGIAFVTFVDPYSVYKALTLDGDLLKTSYVKIKRSDAQGGAAPPVVVVGSVGGGRGGGGRTNDGGRGGQGGDRRRPSREEIADNAMRMSGVTVKTEQQSQRSDGKEKGEIEYGNARSTTDNTQFKRRDSRDRGGDYDRKDSRRGEENDRRDRDRDRGRERHSSRDSRDKRGRDSSRRRSRSHSRDERHRRGGSARSRSRDDRDRRRGSGDRNSSRTRRDSRSRDRERRGDRDGDRDGDRNGESGYKKEIKSSPPRSSSSSSSSPSPPRKRQRSVSTSTASTN